MTLLAHIARRLNKPEDAATEALGYFLNRSDKALRRFIDLLRTFNPEMATFSYVDTRKGLEGSIPDLVGKHGSQPFVLIECKFGAGLTLAQTTNYLSLVPTRVGLLLFIVPNRRLAEISRTVSNSYELTPQPRSNGHFVGISADGHVTAVTDWKTVLDCLEGDEVEPAELDQLRTLCQQMDSPPFVPLKGDELRQLGPTRLVNLLELVDDLVCGARASGFTVSNARWEGHTAYGAYLGDHVWFGLWTDAWEQTKTSPLVLAVNNQMPIAISELRFDGSVQGAGKWHFAELGIPVGVDRGQVVSEMIRQLDKMLVSLEVPKIGATQG